MLSKANVRGLLVGVGLAAGLVGVGSSCHQAIQTAPDGSTITLYANPKSIAAYGGVSVISALVYDNSGQPAADGTVVQFFTELGRVEEQGRTNDGVARVNLVADGRSGVAKVYGWVGGGAPPTTTPTATPSNTSVGGSAALATTESTGSAAQIASTAGSSDNVEVTIGSALPKTVVLSADPRNIARDAPRYSVLTATVFDKDGNPIARVPVVFRLTDTDFTESLESGGQPVFTDNNGQAKDRVFTSMPRDGTEGKVTAVAVVVTDGEKSSNSVEIGINY